EKTIRSQTLEQRDLKVTSSFFLQNLINSIANIIN
ncbi:MAG: hypothetical protein ACI8QQ_002800, partial [Psychroserpens sp.]